MKAHLIALCSILCICSLAHSQVSIDFITFPPLGDSIVRTVAPGDGLMVTEPGPDQTWTWSLEDEGIDLVTSFDTNDRTDLFPLASHKVSNFLSDDYYLINDEQWNLLGSIGQDPVGFGIDVISVYSPGFREESAPLMYLDSSAQRVDQYTGIPLSVLPDSLLDLLPILPDSMRTKVEITNNEIVDAWGVLSINGNETDVLRMKRTQRIVISIEAKISILPWQDITNLILNYLDFLPEDFDLVDTLDTYKFLAPNYGFPVAELAVDSDTITTVTYQSEILSSAKAPRTVLQAISVFPNPSNGEFTVNIPEGVGESRVMIVDAIGRIVFESQDYTPVRQQISLSDPASGMYLLTVWDDRGRLLGMQKIVIQ